MMRQTTYALIPLLATVLWSGCTYEPPPEVSLVQVQDGVFRLGEDIVMEFSVPVDPATLGIRIFPGDVDIEGQLLHTDSPHLGTCRPTNSPCPRNTVFTMAEDRKSATLTLDPEDLGQADVPLALEIRQGLTGDTGIATGTSYWFYFQFKPTDQTLDDSTEDVEFMDGVYLIFGTVNKPLPVILQLMSEFIVLPDGRVAMVGAESDNLEGYPRNTTDPEGLYIDDTDQGFTIFASAEMRSVNHERFVTSEPFAIFLVIGPVEVELFGVVMTGIIVTDEHTGYDRIEGTLSYDGISMSTGGGPTFDYEANSTTFVADYVPPGLVPEGTPRVCGDVCGAVVLGTCQPPEDFPREGFCEEPAE